MDERDLRRKRRRKQEQLRRQKMIRKRITAVVVILALILIIKFLIMPVMEKLGNSNLDNIEIEKETDDSEMAVRRPLKSQEDLAKTSALTPGWHVDENGTWYQNPDGTYFADGFQDIEGYTYCFDENGYLRTGWITKGRKDYFFNNDGSYNPTMKKPMLALTFDAGPGEYTEKLLECLEENDARATFFMLGTSIESYPEIPEKMLEIGCELGSHSWNDVDLTALSLDAAVEEFTRVDDLLVEVCGQPATVARAPYGASNKYIHEAVKKPFFLWSLDSSDWNYRNVQLNYDSVMEGDLTDGSIILMHDVYEESVEAACQLIPALIEQGYKLVTLSEMAEEKNVELQYAVYENFWKSTLESGEVAGYAGNKEVSSEE